MTGITKDEIKNILSKVNDGNKILEYINQLEEHLLSHHHGNCDCGCDEHEEDDEWEKIETQYKNKISVKDWEELLKDETIFSKDALIVVKRMRHVATPVTYAELADMFGLGAMYYSLEMDKLSERIIKKLNIDIEKENYWAVLSECWSQKSLDERVFGLTPALYEAIGNVDLSNIPLRGN